MIMFDYAEFRTIAYKYKYETVFETDSERVRYCDLLARVNAVYNALLRLNLSGGTVMLFARTGILPVCLAFACNRAGFDCVIADSRLPLYSVESAVKKHSPLICAGKGKELSRLSSRLLECGCKSVLVIDESPLPERFPTEYRLSSLIDENDYFTVGADSEKKGKTVFAFDDDTPLPQTDFISDYGKRDAVILDVPFYKRAGAHVLRELIFSCHRIYLTDDFSSKILKKKKVKHLITAGSKNKDFKGETAFVNCASHSVVGGGVFDKTEVGDILSKTSPLDISVDTDGEKIQIFVTVGDDADMDALQFYPPVQALRSVCKEVLYPYNAPKTFTFRQKTV